MPAGEAEALCCLFLDVCGWFIGAHTVLCGHCCCLLCRVWSPCLLPRTLQMSTSEYVTMVVTEFGMIPPSSVPVILREFSESAQHE